MVVGVPLLAGLQLLLALASSETPLVRAWLEVSPASRCVTQADVVARVVARSPRILFRDEPGVLRVEAKVDQTATAVVSTLQFSGQGQPSSPRRLQAASCAEAADALALIIALALDPTATTRATSPEDAAGSPGRSSSGSGNGGNASKRAEPTTPRPRSEPPRETTAPRIAPTQESPKEAEKAPATTASEGATTASDAAAAAPAPAAAAKPPSAVSVAPSSTGSVAPSFTVGLGFEAVAGPAPGIMPGVTAQLRLMSSERPETDGGSMLAAKWSASLALLHVGRGGFEETGGTASFSLDAALLQACPLRLRAARLDVLPCALGLGGRSTASGGGEAEAPATVHRAFGALGVGLALVLNLGRRWALEADVGAGVTLVRDTFSFAPFVFHEASALTTFMTVGLAARL